jgi:hypothetical protein
MNTRKKKVESAKVAAKYGSTAAGAATSALDLIGIFVRIPGFIKWGVVALIGLIAGCFGCCSEMKEQDALEKQEFERLLEEKSDQDERHQMVVTSQQMQQYLAEMKHELEYHHLHTSGADSQSSMRISRIRSNIDKWIALSKDLKHQHDVKDSKASTSGFFSHEPLREPLVDMAKRQVMDDGQVITYHFEEKEPGMGLGLI